MVVESYRWYVFRSYVGGPIVPARVVERKRDGEGLIGGADDEGRDSDR